MAKGDFESHPVQYYDTLLRYYLNLNPDSLSDQEWALTIRQLEDIRKQESDSQ